MKNFAFLLLLILLLPSCAQPQKQQDDTVEKDLVYTEQDAAIFSEIMEKYGHKKDKPIHELIPDIGRYFIGNEYVAHALEETDEEQLIINLRDLDCTTYAEHLFALARTIKSDSATFENYARELERIRYRDGQQADYPSRLHYFSDWIYDNAQKDLVTTPADSFGEPYPLTVNFMSTHTESYKHLNTNPDYIPVIAKQEKEISARNYHYLPKEKIAEYSPLLKEGDIVGITTDIEGLDIAHVGILVEVDGKLHLMHASQSKLKVEVSEEPITSFLQPNSKNTGIMIARPVDKN